MSLNQDQTEMNEIDTEEIQTTNNLNIKNVKNINLETYEMKMNLILEIFTPEKLNSESLWNKIKRSLDKSIKNDKKFIDSTIDINEELLNFVLELYRYQFFNYDNTNCGSAKNINGLNPQFLKKEKKLKIDDVPVKLNYFFNFIPQNETFQYFFILKYENDNDDNCLNLYNSKDDAEKDYSSVKTGLLQFIYDSVNIIKQLKFSKILNKFTDNKTFDHFNVLNSFFEKNLSNFEEEYNCAICKESTNMNLKCNENHHVCLVCRIQLFQHQKENIKCPLCRKKLRSSWLKTFWEVHNEKIQNEEDYDEDDD